MVSKSKLRKIDDLLERAESLIRNGEYERAVQKIGEAFKLDVDNIDALICMSYLCRETGKKDEAEAFLNDALKMDAKNPKVYANLAGLKIDQADPKEAMVQGQKALELDPNCIDAYKYIGNAHLNINDFEGCIKVFEQLLEIDPENPYANWAISYCLYKLERTDEVYPYITKCLNSDIKLKVAHLILGTYYLEHEHMLTEAIECFEKEIELDPRSEKAYGMMGNASAALGKIEKAIDYQLKQIELFKESKIAYNNLVMYLHYDPRAKPKDILDAAKRFYKECHPKEAEKGDQVYNFDHLDLNPNKETLRIGFVSGDFKKHSIFSWIRGLFKKIVDNGFEVYCFCNNLPDVATELWQQEVTQWHDITQLNDKECYDLVKKQKIDVLIDLSGHTALNRLGTFIKKPSPVQALWLGFSAPTGIPQMDYTIVDHHLVREGEDHHYNEKPYRMPHIFAPFHPPTYHTEIEQAPVLKNGYITFGCFNNFMKLNEGILDIWSQILKKVENSKLFLKSRVFHDEKIKNNVSEFFEERGVSRDRLLLEPNDPDKRIYMKAYNRVDISLNPFPLGSATVGHDTLWMGVPIVCIDGNHMSQRTAAALLKNIGHPELITQDMEGYIEKAVELANNPEQIQKYCETFREKYLNSPLVDMDLFAQDFSVACRDMWTETVEKLKK